MMEIGTTPIWPSQINNTGSSNSGGNTTVNNQNQSSNTPANTALANTSSFSPINPIQSLMNNWFAWGEQPNNTAGVEPINTQAALNPMTNQWQFFNGSVSSANIANQTASTAPVSPVSPVSANASPQSSNVLSEVAQEFESAINSIFGNISNFLKNL